MKKFVVYFLVLILSAGISIYGNASSTPVSRLRCIEFIIYHSSINIEEADTTILKQYIDTNKLSEDDKMIVSLALQYNIIKGYEDKTLRLTQNVTRAEFACMIYRIKDYYTSPVDSITYNGNYKDLSYWNEKEVKYCIEHGYLMGYGDVFGSKDNITESQLIIIKDRLLYGLNARQKYSLYEICGTSPISMNHILNSAYDNEICQFTPIITAKGGAEYERPSYDKTLVADQMIIMMDAIGNLDYEKLKDDNYKEYQMNFCFPYSMRTPNQIIFKDDRNITITDIIEEVQKFGTKRESIHVFAPENCYETVFPTVFSTKQACGYEYFRYEKCDNLPEEIELNKWYKRKVTTVYTDTTGRTTTLSVWYGPIETYAL